ncbi:hypothetical protein MHYP_G00262600 [Metynnis hypsauchen]
MLIYSADKFVELKVVKIISTDRGSHSLQYFYTAVTPGINFPEFTVVGQVDGEQIGYYDSNIRKFIPKTEWMKKTEADDPDYWNRETHSSQGHQESFKANVATAMQRFNQTGGGGSHGGLFGVIISAVLAVLLLFSLWKMMKESGKEKEVAHYNLTGRHKEIRCTCNRSLRTANCTSVRCRVENEHKQVRGKKE